MISKFSVKKPYTVIVAVVLVIILGIVSFTKMTTDLLPSMELPYAIVMTTYQGASPETVETTVTKPVEQSMATISNIKEVNSISSENMSMVILEFEGDTDMNAVSLDMREKLDMIKGYWPDEVGNPTIMKLNPAYYIISGYRDSIFYGKTFLDHPALTLYFWGVVLILFVIGCMLMYKFKKKFIDLI